MGPSRRTFPVGALSASALAVAGGAGMVASPVSVLVLLVAVSAVVGPPLLRRFCRREAVRA